MAHVDAMLPGRMHHVFYESIVKDTEAEVRRLLDYCGLPFEEACLRFYENDRPVRTASSEQVRQPIFRDGVDRWRQYEPWLGPLKGWPWARFSSDIPQFPCVQGVFIADLILRIVFFQLSREQGNNDS